MNDWLMDHARLLVAVLSTGCVVAGYIGGWMAGVQDGARVERRRWTQWVRRNARGGEL